MVGKTMEAKQNKFLTVAPFECAWLSDLRFKESGRGCVAFDAFAHNDVTIVFRDQVGSQHYHYKKDINPHYTVIIGSHRNKRLKIEVDGKTVVDEAAAGLCSSSGYQSYWISIYDGLISIGKGRYPFQNLCFQWLDSRPNCGVQYIGLSSWDKHVGYRNVNVLPLTQNHLSLWKHVDFGDEVGEDDVPLLDDQASSENWGLVSFLEKWDFSDVCFVVGKGENVVPAHKIILAACGNFELTLSDEAIIYLPDVSYTVVHAFLQYIYTGQTQVPEFHLSSLKDLSLQFGVIHLTSQCTEIIERSKFSSEPCSSGNNVKISYPNQMHCSTAFPFRLPINSQRLEKIRLKGEFSDVDIYIGSHDLVARSHKIILGLWSVPFWKMFSNGMRETVTSKVLLEDISFEAFQIMLDFMYTGELNKEVTKDLSTLLVQLLLLADQFGVTLLHQECCKTILECLTEESLCPILHVISSVPSCELIEETCKRKFSMHFDYCTTASLDFVYLDQATFGSILQHPDLTVTSEERVLNAVLLWCSQGKKMGGWEELNEIMLNCTPESLFGERLDCFDKFLPFVRFPLLPYELLERLERSCLSRHISSFHILVKEAINFQECKLSVPQRSSRFQHRKSSFKELQYICDGDSNGVLYFAGTSYGEHRWVNPVLSKRVCITASSPVSRYTDPKILVSRTFQGTSFAGPRIENGRNCSWWMIDLGQNHQLICNYYTLRQDGSRAFMRCWNLEGSSDGRNWTILKAHEDDQTISKPGQFASWPVNGPNALLPFRFFRISRAAATTDDYNPWSCCICFLELYGYFM